MKAGISPMLLAGMFWPIFAAGINRQLAADPECQSLASVGAARRGIDSGDIDDAALGVFRVDDLPLGEGSGTYAAAERYGVVHVRDGLPALHCAGSDDHVRHPLRHEPRTPLSALDGVG